MLNVFPLDESKAVWDLSPIVLFISGVITVLYQTAFFIFSCLLDFHETIFLEQLFLRKPVKLQWMEEEDYPVAYVYLGPIHVSPVQALKGFFVPPKLCIKLIRHRKMWWLDLWHTRNVRAFRVDPSSFTSLLSRSYQTLDTYSSFRRLRSWAGGSFVLFFHMQL